ncbi:MAG: tetratricopeptide repeat protein [Syntrophobacteraceae bacterium]|nr:tetratricopeptide repeat protein [Syntrophobacteraceae bacterium]
MARNSALLVVCLLVLSACASGSEGPYNRGVEQYGIGHVGRCVKDYRQAIAQRPDDPRPKFNLAVIYQDEGKLREAENLYEELVARAPGFSPAWSNLASIMEKRGLVDRAERMHRRAMKADGGCAEGCQYGFFLLRQGRKVEAEKVFKKSVGRDPRCANGWFGLGLIAEGNGDIRAALRNYDRDSIYNPSDVEAYLRSSNILISMGDTARAAGLLEKAAGENRAGGDVDHGDIELRLGILFLGNGELKKAEKALELAKKNGAPPGQCDRELHSVYRKLSARSAGEAR